MLVVQYLVRVFSTVPCDRRARPFTLHFSLLVFVLVYAFVGGLIFNKLEANALIAFRKEQTEKANLCVVRILRRAKNYTEEAVKHIESCWKAEVDERTEWNYVTSTLYGFGIVTTLGYNRIAPITLAGRMFCILYGLCGIPVTMITIANVGRYLNTFAKTCRQKLETFRAQHWKKRGKLRRGEDEDDDSETSTGFASLVLLIAFLIYVAFGALLLPLLNGEADFINGLYYNFLCLTAIDFGQLVPQRVAFLPITFMYVCIGLAITTIAIDVGSQYVRKLHYIGQKMKNVATTKIWFGGKTMKVRDLLHEVGSKCGLEPSVIDKIDLDNVIEEVIARSEGKPPPFANYNLVSPHETTAEILSPEPESAGQPTEMQPCYATEESDSSVSISETQQLDTSYKEVAVIQIVDEDEDTEVVGFVQAEVMAVGEEQTIESLMNLAVVTTADYVDEANEDVSSEGPSSGGRSISPIEIRVPRNFWEKKELYGRDALKLFETYQEEWARIANLSDRRLAAPNVPRRKSILHISPNRLYPRDWTPSVDRRNHRSSPHLANGRSREPSLDRSRAKSPKRGSKS